MSKSSIGTEPVYDARTLGKPRMFILGLQHMFAGKAAGQRHTARADADQAQVVRAVVFLEDLMRDAHERAVDGGRKA